MPRGRPRGPATVPSAAVPKEARHMKLRLVLVCGVLAAAFPIAAAAPSLGHAPLAAQTATKPNIIVVLTDDQRWDLLGFMPRVKARLVDRGVTFSKAFVTTSLCCPSRASIL